MNAQDVHTSSPNNSPDNLRLVSVVIVASLDGGSRVGLAVAWAEEGRGSGGCAKIKGAKK